jgi:elongation factor Ts
LAAEIICLYEQPFVKRRAIWVGDLIEAKIAELGERISVTRFARMRLGDAPPPSGPN